MTADLHALSIAELSGLIAARKLSPVELVDSLIHRVEQYDTQTRAFVTPTFDLARKQAREAEAEIAAGRYRGALHGVPFALKDCSGGRTAKSDGRAAVLRTDVPSTGPLSRLRSTAACPRESVRL
jgi:aspartyl-tRNA(Asn)/glutamyl-tRNA(Gln) amidotransferase subunit A